jgi:AcrR family transcriptional regulator
MNMQEWGLTQGGLVKTSSDESSDIDVGNDDTTGVSERRSQNQRFRSERHRQIANAAVAAIARYGLSGVTNRRIAEGTGLSAPALYLYFESQREILCAAMDLVSDKLSEWLAMSTELDAVERLRELGTLHTSIMLSQLEAFLVPSFEFITAPQELGLRERWGQKQRSVNRMIADIVEDGKIQGSIRDDVDVEVAAWQFMMIGILEDIARLTGRNDYIEDGVSMKILEAFLTGIRSSQVDPITLG